MNHLSVLSLLVCIQFNPHVFAQAPAGKDASPPAKTESTPAAEPSREAVGKYVTELKAYTAGARRDFTRMIASFNDLRAERQSLSSLRAKLDHAASWLETHKDAK